MPHRDDVEASRARADALARELEEVKAEREALRRENDELKNPPPKKKKKEAPPEKEPESSRKQAPTDEERFQRKVRWIGYGVGAALIFGIGGFVCNHNRERARQKEAYEKANAEYEALDQGWHDLDGLEPCVRGAELTEARARAHAPVTWGESATVTAPEQECVTDADKLQARADLAPPARTALRAWVAIERELDGKAKALNEYVSNRDYKDDWFRAAPGMWAAVVDVLDRRRPVIAQLVRDAFPVIREEIRGYQRREETRHGKSIAWWSIELGIEHWEIGEIAMRASGVRDGKPLDREAMATAIKPAVEAWLKHAADAPIEVRRTVRGGDYWTDAVKSGGKMRDDFDWDVIRTDSNPLARNVTETPGLPEKPVPPPDEDD